MSDSATQFHAGVMRNKRLARGLEPLTLRRRQDRPLAFNALELVHASTSHHAQHVGLKRRRAPDVVANGGMIFLHEEGGGGLE